MKIRNGFVSNSSSSSFIVFSKNPELDLGAIEKLSNLLRERTFPWDKGSIHYELELPLAEGNKEFDGRFEEYTSFEDRLNYITYQIMGRISHHGMTDWMAQEMEGVLTRAIKETLGDKLQGKWLMIRFDYNRGFHDGYIDHASVFPSRDWSDEVFYSTKAMQNFLFCKGSKVEDGNDYYTGPGEEDCPDEYAEAYRYMEDSMDWFRNVLFEPKDKSIERLKKEIRRLDFAKMTQKYERESLVMMLKELGGTEDVD